MGLHLSAPSAFSEVAHGAFLRLLKKADEPFCGRRGRSAVLAKDQHRSSRSSRGPGPRPSPLADSSYCLSAATVVYARPSGDTPSLASRSRSSADSSTAGWSLPSSQAPRAMKVKIKCWNGVATWLWVANDENCGICRMAFNGCCPDCECPLPAVSRAVPIIWPWRVPRSTRTAFLGFGFLFPRKVDREKPGYLGPYLYKDPVKSFVRKRAQFPILIKVTMRPVEHKNVLRHCI